MFVIYNKMEIIWIFLCAFFSFSRSLATAGNSPNTLSSFYTLSRLLNVLTNCFKLYYSLYTRAVREDRTKAETLPAGRIEVTPQCLKERLNVFEKVAFTLLQQVPKFVKTGRNPWPLFLFLNRESVPETKAEFDKYNGVFAPLTVS